MIPTINPEVTLLNWIIFCGSIMLAVSVSFCCSLLESALLSLGPSQLAEIRKKKAKRADLCTELRNNVETPLAVILISNTAAHTIGAAVAGAELAFIFGSAWLGVFTLLFTLIMVQYTELLPKTLGVRFNVEIMSVAAPMLNVLGFVFLPFIRLAHYLNRPFEPEDEESKLSATAEISALASMARSTREISSRQEHIIKAAPRLSEQTLDQLMIPKNQISFLSTTQSVIDAINVAHMDFHTRYPVCENGDRNDVVGYVNFKELVAAFRARPETMKLTDIIRPIAFVSPEDTGADLLERFAVKNEHLAIVRSSKGHTLGLVTMEDIVEELVGDLDDEFDSLSRTFFSPNDGVWVIGGGLQLSMVASETHLMLPESNMNVSEWFCRKVKSKDKVRPGVTYRIENAEFTVRKVRRGRVMEFNLRRIDE